MRVERREARGERGRFPFYALRFALWGTAVLLFWFILRTVSLAETWVVLRRLDGWQLVLLAAVNGLVLLLMNGRWWLILRGQGHRIPYLALTRYRLAGASLSYITPGPQFGGEPLQVLLIERHHGVGRETAVAAITLDKTLELMVNFSFLVVGVWVVWQTRLLGEVAAWQTAVFPLFLLALPLTCLVGFWRDWQMLAWFARLPIRLLRHTPWAHRALPWQQSLTATEQAITRLCQQQPATLTLALLCSLLAWLALMAEFWLMLALLGIDVTFLQMVVILTAARVAILLPLPGGLGTLEASQVYALTAFGFEPATALSVSLLIRARDVLLAGLGLWITRSSFLTVPPS
ncbi:MAG: flippase-like domain-containing protein [Ardenticatenaceae bacterium]|nr:flippase-like domain-containing protein [Ardenticatenaceae bacterium]